MITDRRALLGAAAAGLVVGAAPVPAFAQSPPARVRRAYVDAPFGQVHLRDAGPRSSRRTPVACLHQTPLSSRMFEPFLAELGRDRRALALDTPGYGESEGPTTRPSLEQYADVLGAALQAAGRGPYDLIGYHTGTVMAVALAVRRPALVRRLVLASLPLFTPERRREVAAGLRTSKPPLADDGEALFRGWRSGVSAKGPGQTLEMLRRGYAEKLRPQLDRTEWALEALLEYPLERELPKLRQPTLLLASKDSLREPTLSAARLIPNARTAEAADLGHGLFDVAPGRLAALVRDFLDSR